MDASNTDSQRLLDKEIEEHTIVFTETDTPDIKLNKIAANLNGKTHAIAKLRHGQTKMIKQLSEAAKITPLVMEHQQRFERFDQLCGDWLVFVEKVWREIKDIGYQAVKKAFIIFIATLVLYALYHWLNQSYPEIELQKPIPSPSS